METLPNELLIHIASHVDSPSPSIAKFAHEPCKELTESPQTPLKFLSLVSWRWRKITLPLLFQYTHIALDEEPQWVPIDARLIDSMQTQLTSLSNHEFQIYHKMRSKFKSSSTFAFDEAYDDILINLCRIQDGDNFLKAIPHILWIPHLPKSYPEFEKFVAQYDLTNHIKSIVIHTDREYGLRHVTTADAPLARAVAEIWSQIFTTLDPTRVVVAAPPTTLAGLLDTQMLSADAWAFDMEMHYISLTQFDSHRCALYNTDPDCRRPWGTTLIHYRPWTHLAYNEGSSITAYSTYEYHLKQSPKMLYLILLRLGKEVGECCNITSFSFTGVFPFSTNIKDITRALRPIPSLRQIAFQLAPGPESGLLDDSKRMGRAQSADLWLEFHDGYAAVGEWLAGERIADGTEFTSRDCWIRTQTVEVEVTFEALEKKGIVWRERAGVEGVWVRDRGADRVMDGEETVEYVVL